MNIDERLADILKIYSPENKDLIPDTIVLLKALMVEVTDVDNPYPKNIFIEPTKEQCKLVYDLLALHGLTIDKFSGSFGRMVWNNCKKEIRDRINKEKGGATDIPFIGDRTF